MFSKKFSSNIRRKKRMIISSIILLVVFLGLGYSAFTTNLGINGTLTVDKYDQTLYGVLEKAAKKGTYAKEYTGEHQDSMAGVGDKKIYHWYAPNTTAGNTIANEILDKNNVIFADHCWQMIRTTDTGGVKMIYNGEAEGNQCLNTRGNHVGYTSRSLQQLDNSYYYGTSYVYDKVNNVFSLDGTVTAGTIQLGQYTCKQTTSTGTCETLYLVDKYHSASYYYTLVIKGNSVYSQLGTLPYNSLYNSPSYVGYMYNTVYETVNRLPLYYIQNGTSSISPNYYYSDTIDYGNINTDQYTLINPQLMSELSDYSELIGKYFILNNKTSESYAFYILAVDGSTIYYRKLEAGDLTISMVMGSSYTDNGDGTYTINSPTVVSYIDWYNSSYSSAFNKYICDGTNATCENIKHISSKYKNRYNYWETDDTYKYSESINYSNGSYTLTGDIKTAWDIYTDSDQEILSTHHYTCLNSGTSCTNVNYVYNVSVFSMYYIVLNDGSNIETALSNMLSSDNVNQNNSIIKTGIDAWYKEYLIDYTSYLEDVIYCSDRSIKNIGGWNPSNGGVSSTNRLDFVSYGAGNSINGNIKCTNEVDKFSMSNAKAQLIYPIGLLSTFEMSTVTNNNIRKTGNAYYLGSPGYFKFQTSEASIITTTGSFAMNDYGSSLGIRPAISLKPGTEYASGTGSMADPYIVE